METCLSNLHAQGTQDCGWISGQLGYIDSCPNQPVPSKAFCEKHCNEAELNNIPTKLREYVSSCRKMNG